jgi:hypothetical protein
LKINAESSEPLIYYEQLLKAPYIMDQGLPDNKSDKEDQLAASKEEIHQRHAGREPGSAPPE